MRTKIRIRKHERGILYRYGDFRGVLRPGAYRLWSRLWSRTRDSVEIVSTLATRFEHPLLDVMVAAPEMRDELIVVNLGDTERAIVWRDDRLFAVLGPGRYALWREPAEIAIETYGVDELRFAHPRLDMILPRSDAQPHLMAVDVQPYETVLVFRDGKLVDTLSEGRYAYWRGAGVIGVRKIDRREQVLDVAGQEIMTSDKVTLRVNLIVTWTTVDALKAVTVVQDASQALYREAQLALREAVGTRTLEALLTSKDAIGEELRAVVANRAAEFGIAVRAMGLKDIILPGDMKALLNQVIEAEKQAEANLIRRREETAAARSQANTARLLAENPQLARIKELELLGEILRGTNATFVFDRGELASQVRTLVGGRSE